MSQSEFRLVSHLGRSARRRRQRRDGPIQMPKRCACGGSIEIAPHARAGAPCLPARVVAGLSKGKPCVGSRPCRNTATTKGNDDGRPPFCNDKHTHASVRSRSNAPARMGQQARGLDGMEAQPETQPAGGIVTVGSTAPVCLKRRTKTKRSQQKGRGTMCPTPPAGSRAWTKGCTWQRCQTWIY